MYGRRRWKPREGAALKQVYRQSPCSSRLRRGCFLGLWLLVLGSLPEANAQLEITSSPNVVGSGARALGMGGAFIAVADDATAASWNPGGLTQLERPEVSWVLKLGRAQCRGRARCWGAAGGAGAVG